LRTCREQLIASLPELLLSDHQIIHLSNLFGTVHRVKPAIHPVLSRDRAMRARMEWRRTFSMRTRGMNFAVIAALELTFLSGMLAAQTPAEKARAQYSAGHPAFQGKTMGQGRAIIMIPGLASSGATFDSTVQHLRGRFQCIELTLAGFAGVPPIPGPLLTEARDQIAEYIRDNHLDRPVIMGHSLGGSIALDLAAHYPELVGPVIVVDSLPFFAGAWFQAHTLAEARPGIEQMRKGMESMTHQQWEAMTRSGASTNSMATNEADQKKLIEWGLESDQKRVTDALIELVSTDLRPELSKIETPVLVLGTWVGLQTYGVTEEAAIAVFKEQYSSVKHLTFAMSDKARHFVMWDDPAWFNSQVDAFLAANAGAKHAEQ
jgi:N-formylmaleamate deformylase